MKINIKNFNYLSKVCNKILNDKKSTLFTYSINFLHLVKLHNDYLIDQKFYFNRNIFYNKNILIFFLNILKWLYRVIENYTYFFFLKKKKLDKNYKVILVSYINNKKNNFREKHDHVYGSIPKYLKSLYKNNLKIIYINNTSLNSLIFINKDKNTLILDNILSLAGEIKVLFWQFREAINVFINFFLKKKINYFLYLCLLFSIFSKSTKKNLRLYYQFNKILKINNCHLLILTLEGFAWEKLFFCAARNNNSETKLLGYQFTGILQNQNWLKQMKPNNYNPDQIITCGPRNKKILNKINSHYKNKIFNIGSNRNLLYKKNRNVNKNMYKSKIPVCLVLPEGTERETFLLFNYAIKIAKITKNVKFILRTHPLIDITIFRNKLGLHKNYLHNNVIFSNKSFGYDINRSNFALYRGTTSVVTALNNNLIPLYYSYPKELFKIDPIYDYEIDKFVVKNVNDFLRVIKVNNLSYRKNLKKQKYSNYFYATQNQLKIYDYFNSLIK